MQGEQTRVVKAQSRDIEVEAAGLQKPWQLPILAVAREAGAGEGATAMMQQRGRHTTTRYRGGRGLWYALLICIITW